MSSLEVLEARIAPAMLTIVNPLPDIVAGVGKTGATVDLGNLFDAAGTFHTFVTIHTNFDSDPNTAGVQGDITLELLDDKAPLTVQNFLSYVTTANKNNDYTGTFFNRLVPGFVLQGGTFNTTFANGSYTSVATQPAVHNEFSVLNTAGTVAMAKLPVDPNSATSAFFFNLADNTSLDTQNGGFTVFARVFDTASMNVVNAIAGITPKNLTPSNSNSPFTTVPTQDGYNADPDANAATPPPAPTPAQLISITGISVNPPTHGSSPGKTFTITSITDANGLPTNLVTGRLSGDTLSLAYRHGGSGVAKVTVMATDGVDSATDDFLVKVQPNLAVTVTDTYGADIVPGDHGTATVKVTNNTAGAAVGRFDVKLFLVQVNAATGVQIGSLSNLSLSLASGASRALAVPIEVTEALTASQGENYVITASVVPVAGSTFSELYTDDNFNGDHLSHALYNGFGSFNTPSGMRTNVPLTYLDANNHKVTMTLTGGGFGQLNVNANGVAPDLGINNANGASVLTAKTIGGHTTLHTVYVAQPGSADAAPLAIGSITMPTVDLTGDFQAIGGIKSLALGDLKATDGMVHSLYLGLYAESATQKATITLGNVTDYSLQALQPVATLRALNWLDVDSNTETVKANYLDTFSVTGTFEADFSTLSGAKLLSFTAGNLHNSVVRLGGGVNSVVLGNISASNFLVGTPTIPATVTDFTSYAQVGSFRVTGAVQAGSHIVAGYFARILVGGVDTTGSTDTFGFVADVIGSYQRGTVRLANLGSGQYDVVGTASTNYQVNAL